MNKAGTGTSVGVEKLLTHAEVIAQLDEAQKTGPKGLMTHDQFNALIEVFKKNPNLLGNYPEALVTHEHLSNFIERLATHIDFSTNKDLEEKVSEALVALGTHEAAGRDENPKLEALGTHEDKNAQPLAAKPLEKSTATAQPLQKHKDVRATTNVLKEGTVLGLDINAHELDICRALKYYEDTDNEIMIMLFKPIVRYYTGSWTGYSPEHIAAIRMAQVEKTVSNMDRIERLLTQKHINYAHVTAEIAKLTGGLVMAISHPAGKALQDLERMVNLHDQCLERAQGDTPEAKANALKEALEVELEKGTKDGSGFSALAWGLKRMAVDAYNKDHPTEETTVKGEKGDVKIWNAKWDDAQLHDEEFFAREVAACIRNGITSANGVEAYFKREHAKDYDDERMRSIIASAIQKAVVEECILDPYEPVYDSSMSPQDILAEELYASWYNMQEDDRRTPDKVMEYLKVYRGILDVRATRAGGTKAHNISERALYAYIKQAINDKRLATPLEYDENTNIITILEKELFAYRLNKPNDASKDYETVKAFEEYLKTQRKIFKIKGISRRDNVPKEISEDVLMLFLNRLIMNGVMPEKIGKEPKIDLNNAWEDYLMAEPEGAENDPEIENAFREHILAKTSFKENVQDELDKFFKDLRTKPIVARGSRVPVAKSVSITPEVENTKSMLELILDECLIANPGRNKYDGVVLDSVKAEASKRGAPDFEVEDFIEMLRREGKEEKKEK